MNIDLSRPVVWTVLGNCNVDDLEKFVEWSRHGDTIKFRIVYKYEGEIVREDAHAHVITGLSTIAEQAAIA
jgi:hypothetical protein